MEFKSISLDEPIENLELSAEIKRILKENHMETVSDLVNTNIFLLIAMDEMHLLHIAHIKKGLEAYGLTFTGSDYIDVSDFYDPDRNEMIRECQQLIHVRNELRGKSDFLAEQMFLLGKIYELFEKNFQLRKKANWNQLEKQSRTF